MLMQLKLLLVQSMLPLIPIFCPTPNLLKRQLRKVFTLKTCDLGGLGLSVVLSHRALSQSDERAMPRGSIHRAIGHPMLEFCVCRSIGNSVGSACTYCVSLWTIFVSSCNYMYLLLYLYVFL